MVSKKYNEVLRKLEKGIVGKENLDLAKKELTELSLAYIDEITKVTENYNNRILEIEEKIAKLEEGIEITIETDDLDLMENSEEPKIQLSETITCPYCHKDILVEYDEKNHEIACPNCDNLIELDWGEFEDDM